MLQAVMAEAGSGFRDLDLLATTVGPGAFTGLRIGLSTARAMALAAALPLLGLTTLETVAAAQDPVARGARPLLVALETRRADVYVQLFGADRSEEHTSELQSLMRISYAVFCLKKKKKR